MPRLFISHSSKDNIVALALRQWLVANGWREKDVFVDLHDLRAGTSWRASLRKANAASEALLLLASPEALRSREVQEELQLADLMGKEIIPVIARELALDDPLLSRYTNREIQIVDLRAMPTERMPEVDYDNKKHELEFSIAALAAIKGRLDDLGISPGSYPWAAKDKTKGPYPGLAAFGEDDAGIFFGREADTVTGLAKLKLMRMRHAPRLLVIQAASGAGKSSFLRAGLWPRLLRDDDFAPLAILRPAQGILTGPGGIGHGIAGWFQQHGRRKIRGDIESSLMQEKRESAIASFGELLSEAMELATADRRAGLINARTPALLLAIDQGEELFASKDKAESGRFIDLLASVFDKLPPDVDLYALLTIRSDNLEPLLRQWPQQGLEAPETQLLPPLSPTAYQYVITKPAEVYSLHVHHLEVTSDLVNKLADDTMGGDALPLLAFTLRQLFDKFGAGGRLTLAHYNSLGGIGGAIDSALADAKHEAGETANDENLRRLIVPSLASWDREANASRRLVARTTELFYGAREQLKPLAASMVNQRLLISSAQDNGKGGLTLEVAHEALLRREPINGWVTEQKDALKLRDDVLLEAREWETTGRQGETQLRGKRLKSVLKLQADPDYASALIPASDYIAAGHQRALRIQAAIFTLIASIILALMAFVYQSALNRLIFQQFRARPTPNEAALVLPEGKPFWDCAKSIDDYSVYCPGMVVVPAGMFMMGSPENEIERGINEGPRHKVTIGSPIAVAMHDITFDQYDACFAAGGCNARASDSEGGWGRGRRPVINVSWDDAQAYVKWLSEMTGHTYRLLTSAEWEYAARAHSVTPWFFGSDESTLGEYAWFNRNSGDRTHPVGEKKPNAFGLYDMIGNVWQWVEDCEGNNYNNASDDGRPNTFVQGCNRVVRGGAFDSYSKELRSANHYGGAHGDRHEYMGFRVARVLVPPRLQ
jgi:formylglycine-generating enzyme required for sulfatase activity